MKWLLLAVALCTYSAVAFSQQVLNPRPVAAACAYNTSPPAPVAGQFYYVQCDSLGRIIVQ